MFLEGLGIPAGLFEEVPLCPSSIILGMWQVFDGQDAPLNPEFMEALGLAGVDDDTLQAVWSRGLLGGYSVYNHWVSTVLLPFATAMKLTSLLRQKISPLAQHHKSKLAFACSYNLSKILFVDVNDGAVYSFTRRPERELLELVVPASADALDECDSVVLHSLLSKPELNGAHGALGRFDSSKGRWQVKMDDGSDCLIKPENIKSLSHPQLWPPEPADNFARWFEGYVRRLEDGIYSKMPLVCEQPHMTEGICLFPTGGPELTRCVTRGVEVTASCIYVPEHPQGWTYTLTFQLVADATERGFETCQLHTRRWEIQEDGQEMQTVEGEGVIGFKPILKDGGWMLNSESDPHGQYRRQPGLLPGPFRYQSASGRNRSMSGTFGGQITFVPGTIQRPTGPPFNAKVQPFRLRVPKYVY